MRIVICPSNFHCEQGAVAVQGVDAAELPAQEDAQAEALDGQLWAQKVFDPDSMFEHAVFDA